MKLLLMLAALQAALVQDVPPATRLDRIEMDRNSWGKPVSRWVVDASGKGQITRPEPGVFDARRMVTRRFDAGTAGFRKIRVLIGYAELRAGRALPCTERITDAAYGTVRWISAGGRTAELRYDAGCRDRIAAEAVRQLQKADAQIAAWAAADRKPIIEEVEKRP
jgi:hypothetical protein